MVHDGKKEWKRKWALLLGSGIEFRVAGVRFRV